MASRKKDDAITLLKQDHREVEILFKEFEQLEHDGSDAIEQIIATACIELKMHDRLETEIFYPGIREGADEDDVRDLLDEAEVEHNTVRELLAKIEGMSAEDGKRKAHFTVLMEYVKHHVKEEEKEMFPKVKKLGIDLTTLGQQMKERKLALMQEMGMDVGELVEDEAEQTS